MLPLAHVPQVGPFQIIRPVAAGGMAKVFLARDPRTGENVALKVLADWAEEERFDREVRILSSFDHPNVVRYVAHGTTRDGQRWLAMEWLEGEDLEARLARGPLTLDETLVVARALADVLACAHRRGLTHRDLKPANIFLVDGDLEQIRVLDFGIAGAVDSRITKTGMIMGTPQYMAPEQAMDVKHADARVDVFALGAVLFHCLTGRAPYTARTLEEIIAQVICAEVPHLSEIVPFVPEDLSALVARLMARDPAQRPADGFEALREVAQIRTASYFDEESVTHLRAALVVTDEQA